MIAGVIAWLAVEVWAALSSWTFVLAYHFLSRGMWRLTQIGRHLMALAVVDGMVFTLLLGAALFPVMRAQGFRWLYVAAVAGIPITTTWRLWIMLNLYGMQTKWRKTMDKIAKAVLAGIGSAAAAWQASDSAGASMGRSLVTALVSGVVVGFGVYYVPNKVDPK